MAAPFGVPGRWRRRRGGEPCRGVGPGGRRRRCRGGDVVDAFVAGSPCDGVDGAEDAHLQIDRRLLHGGLRVGGLCRAKGDGSVIGANGRAANDDSLRCWRFQMFFAWVGGTKCAGNLVAPGNGSPSRPGRVGVVDGWRCGERLRGGFELDDETSRGVLKSGERVGVGEGGLEVGEDLGHGSMAGRRGRLRWRVSGSAGGCGCGFGRGGIVARVVARFGR